jgi:hypothetical protein
MNISDNLLLDLARFLYSLYNDYENQFENIITVSNVFTAVANIYIDRLRRITARQRQSKLKPIGELCDETIQFFAKEEKETITPIISLVTPYFNYLDTKSKQQTSQTQIKRKTSDSVIQFLGELYEKYKNDYEINNLSFFIAGIISMSVDVKDDIRKKDDTSETLKELVGKMVEYLKDKPIYFLYSVQPIAPPSLDLLDKSAYQRKEEEKNSAE